MPINSPDIAVTLLGDSAVTLRLPDGVDPARVTARLRNAGIAGIVDLVPAYQTISVMYDPSVHCKIADVTSVVPSLTARLLDAIRGSTDTSEPDADLPPRVVDIPVCYEPQFGLDLAELAAAKGLSPADAVNLHSSGRYRVVCIGFTPGFPYLAGLPAALTMPRRPAPRKQVPAGSVGIGGNQTGIYPHRSPGGWNIIGRTPLRLFEANRTPASMLRPGDTVRFTTITGDEFRRLADETDR